MLNLKQNITKTLCIVALLSSNAVFSSGHFGFESAEHIAAGENVKLFFSHNDPGQYAYELHLQNGLALTYAQLLALSGDFYAIPGQPISQGTTLEERKARFIDAFNTLSKDPTAVNEVPQIYTVIERERTEVLAGIKNGETPEAVYARIGDDDNRQWNCITGGGCGAMWWSSQGRYLNLAKKDFDHFGDNAWLAYQAGHAVAMDAAMIAHSTSNTKELEIAYAMNAFASHFLSDRFASGHMRTPRPQLPASVTPSVIGSLLATYMHVEDNQNGLHVHNLRGQHWIASGDRYYYNSQNELNRSMLQATLQESINQIYDVYKTGVVSTGEDSVYAMLPQPDEIKNNMQHDVATLFYWDDETKTLYRRSDVANPYDNHWTSDWWGWSTLILLAEQHGIPTDSQQSLVAAGYGSEAMHYGLITDKSLLNYVKKSSLR